MQKEEEEEEVYLHIFGTDILLLYTNTYTDIHI